MKKNRRTFLNRLWAFIGILACVEVGWIGSSIFKSRKTGQRAETSEQIVDAGKTDQFKPNTVTPIPQGRFYLACLDDGSFLALSRTCTHLGCSVPWDEKQHKFICPCHGSTFNIKGEVLTAPAIRPLDIYPVRIENEVIKVHVFQSTVRDSFTPSQAVKL